MPIQAPTARPALGLAQSAKAKPSPMAAGPRQQHRFSSLAPQYASAPPRNARESFETWPETASSLGQSATARQNRRSANRSRPNWRLAAPSAAATPTSNSPADARRGIRIARLGGSVRSRTKAMRT